MSFGLVRLIFVNIFTHYISHILKFICCLFHEQASVERESSDKNIVNQVNMEDTTMVAKKDATDPMRFHSLNHEETKMDKTLIKAVKISHKEYILLRKKINCKKEERWWQKQKASPCSRYKRCTKECLREPLKTWRLIR